MANYFKGKDFPLEHTLNGEIWNSKDFLKERQKVFNFLLKVTKKLSLTNKNLFKSFMAFDHYYSIKGINGGDFLKIGIVCLFIMTKFEDGKILSYTLFTEFFNGNLTKEEYHNLEAEIL